MTCLLLCAAGQAVWVPGGGEGEGGGDSVCGVGEQAS